MKKAVVLFSGGLDSTTVLHLVIKNQYQPYCLTFDYGQKHSIEIENTINIIKSLNSENISHKVVKVANFGGSALTDEIEVPKNLHYLSSIPSTYVPGRNTIFLSNAMAYAEVIGADDIFIGANSVDFSQYPDCREEFIRKFEELANIATARGVSGNKLTIHAPLQHLNKKEIIELGMSLGVDYSKTKTCYDPVDEYTSCGICDACFLRKKGFAEAGYSDPIKYKE